MKLLLLGPQGSGKGTVGKLISERFGIPIISVGQTLRDMPVTHPRKKEITELLERGELAPQDLAAELLKEETSKDRCKNGFIFDGWGRVLIDLYYFDPDFDKAIYLSIPREISIGRIVSRRTCSKCGAIFNILTVPPKVEGICDICGGELLVRDDDTEEALNRRLEIFYTETMKVIDKFRNEGKLIEVDGSGTPEEVFQLVLKALM